MSELDREGGSIPRKEYRLFKAKEAGKHELSEKCSVVEESIVRMRVEG